MDEITGFDRYHARMVIHHMGATGHYVKQVQDHIEPLAHPALYAALQHVIDATEEAEEALLEVMPLIAPREGEE